MTRRRFNLDRALRELKEAGDDALLDLALTKGWVGASAMQEARAAAEREGRPPLEELVLRGHLKASQLDELRRSRTAAEVAAASNPAPPPDVEMALRDPSRRIGRYVLTRELGRGGGGTVWKSWDLQLHRWVAVKLPRDASRPAFLERFLREARTTAGLRHPHLVAIHDFGEHEGRPYLVMELIHGRPIGPEDGPRGGAELVRRAALALAEAHRQGVVHRDLKPGNLLVDERGEPHVVDFGLALLEGSGSDLTRDGAVLGTPAYMAPEQARGKASSADPRTDVYGLGAVLYEVLTGKPPHWDPDPVALAARVAQDEPVPPRRIRPDVPADLESICLRALEKEPERRYPTATALAEDLGRFLQGHAVLAKPSSAATRLVKRVRRHPRLWTGAAVAAIALAAIGTVALRATGSARRSQDQLVRERSDRELAAAHYELRLKTAGAMRRLEDAWHGGPAADGALAEVETACREASDRHPQLRLPRAWRGLAVFYAGREDEGRREMEAAAEDAGRDPFPAVLRAVAALADYSRQADIPVSFVTGRGGIRVLDFIETGRMPECRDEATAWLARAMERADGTHGREYEAFAQAAMCLARREYPAAIQRLAGLRGDPFFEGLSGLLSGLARFITGDVDGAVKDWSPAAARGWGRAHYFSGIALMSRVPERSTPGESHRPLLEGAKRHLDLADRAGVRLRGLYAGRSGVRLLLADLEIAARRDPIDLLQESMNEAERMIGAQAREPRHFLMRAATLGQVGRLLARAGHDGREAIEKAVEAAGLAGHEGQSMAVELLLVRARMDPSDEAGFRRVLDAADRIDRNSAHYPDVLMNRTQAGVDLAQAIRRRGGDASGLFDSARLDLEELLRRDPSNAEAWNNLGVVFLRCAESARMAQEDPLPLYGKAIQALEKAVAAGSTGLPQGNLGIALFGRAVEQRRRGEDPRESLERAIAECTAAILKLDSYETRRTRALAQRLLAQSLLAEGVDPRPRLERALEDWNAAIRMRPGQAEAHRERGYLHATLGLNAEAAADWKESLRLNPDQADLKANLEKLGNP